MFIGAAWHRCRVHFLRNVLAQVPKGSTEMVVARDPRHLRPVAGTVLAEAHDEWQIADKRCLAEGTMALLTSARPKEVAQPALLTA